MVGHKIVASLKEFSNAGVHVTLLHKKGVEEYLIHEARYSIEITLEPHKLLELIFTYHPPHGKTLHYHIEVAFTQKDAHASAQHEAQAEAQVVAFLDQLLQRKILTGSYNRRAALVVPAQNEHKVISAGRFIESARVVNSNDFKAAQKTLTPLKIK